MAGVWIAFWICVYVWFEDVEDLPHASIHPAITRQMSVDSSPGDNSSEKYGSDETLVPLQQRTMSSAQWGVVICMCWFAMTCFFILGMSSVVPSCKALSSIGAWESNIPVFTAGEHRLQLSPFGAGNFIALGGITTFPFLMMNLFLARRIQDRHILLAGVSIGAIGLVTFTGLLAANRITYGTVFACWWLVALGFNLASTVTVSLLSKQLPQEWNGRTSLAIQYSNYTGRVSGAIWGGSGFSVGMLNYAGLEIAIAGIGTILFTLFWKNLKTKTG